MIERIKNSILLRQIKKIFGVGKVKLAIPSSYVLRGALRNYVKDPLEKEHYETFFRLYTETFSRGFSTRMLELMKELELLAEKSRLKRNRFDFNQFMELEMKKQLFYWEERERRRQLALERLQAHLAVLRKGKAGKFSLKRLTYICETWLTPPHALRILDLFRRMHENSEMGVVDFEINELSRQIDYEFLKEKKRERVLAGRRLMECRVLAESQRSLWVSPLDEEQAERFRKAYREYLKYPAPEKIMSDLVKESKTFSESPELPSVFPAMIATGLARELERELNFLFVNP